MADQCLEMYNFFSLKKIPPPQEVLSCCPAEIYLCYFVETSYFSGPPWCRPLLTLSCDNYDLNDVWPHGPIGKHILLNILPCQFKFYLVRPCWPHRHHRYLHLLVQLLQFSLSPWRYPQFSWALIALNSILDTVQIILILENTFKHHMGLEGEPRDKQFPIRSLFWKVSVFSQTIVSKTVISETVFSKTVFLKSVFLKFLWAQLVVEEELIEPKHFWPEIFRAQTFWPKSYIWFYCIFLLISHHF